MRVENTADGGTNGAAVTVANSGAGSGTAWTSTAIGLTALFAYDTSNAAYGAAAYRVANLANLVSNYVTWNSTVLGSVARMYGRAYVKLSVGGYLRELVRWRNGANDVGRLRISAAGVLELRNKSNAAMTSGGVGTVVLQANTQYRIEWDIRPGSTQTNTVKLFAGHDTTPLETITGTGDFSTATTINEQGIGQFTTAVLLPDMWFDAIVATDVGYPGPALVTVAGTRAVEASQVRAGVAARTVVSARVRQSTVVRAGLPVRSAAGARVAEASVVRGASVVRVAAGARVVEGDRVRNGTPVRVATGAVVERSSARVGTIARSATGRRTEVCGARGGVAAASAGGGRVVERAGSAGAPVLAVAGGRVAERAAVRAGMVTSPAAGLRASDREQVRPGVPLVTAAGVRSVEQDGRRGAAVVVAAAGQRVREASTKILEDASTIVDGSRVMELDGAPTGTTPESLAGQRVHETQHVTAGAATVALPGTRTACVEQVRPGRVVYTGMVAARVVERDAVRGRTRITVAGQRVTDRERSINRIRPSRAIRGNTRVLVEGSTLGLNVFGRLTTRTTNGRTRTL